MVDFGEEVGVEEVDGGGFSTGVVGGVFYRDNEDAVVLDYVDVAMVYGGVDGVFKWVGVAFPFVGGGLVEVVAEG